MDYHQCTATSISVKLPRISFIKNTFVLGKYLKKKFRLSSNKLKMKRVLQALWKLLFNLKKWKFLAYLDILAFHSNYSRTLDINFI